MNNNLVKCLAYNRQFKNAVLNAEQLDANTFNEWKNAVTSLHTAMYPVALSTHDNLVKHDNKSVNLDAVYTFTNTLVDLIGEVNGYKLHNNDFVNALINYLTVSASSYKVKDVNPDLMLARSQKRNNEALLRNYRMTKGVSAEAIANLEETIETNKKTIAELESQPNNCIREFTISSYNTFRTTVERILGDIINNQLGKSIEQLAIEEEARKEARKAARKAKKVEKAQSEKQ